MLKYIKRRRVDEVNSENESELSEPGTNKVEKEVTDKKFRLYNDSYLAMGFPWTGDENCPLALCIVCGEKTVRYGCGPGKVKSTLQQTTATCQIKKLITSNDFWISKTNNVKFLRRK
jgi:hypothetical protein